MTGTEIAQVCTGIATVIAAIASVFAVVRIQYVKKSTNSLVTQLLIEGKAASRAEGVQEGRAEERAERAARRSRGEVF